jgi:glycosyltransferase involved in cell wall biosynthesis
MKKALLHVVRCYPRRPPCPGGMEKHIASLSREQRRIGIRVTDVFNDGEPEGEGVQILACIKLHRVHPAALRDLLFYVAAIARLRRMPREGGRCVIHVHGDWSAFVFARILRRVIRADILAATIHGSVRRPLLLSWALYGAGVVFSTGKDAADRIAGAIHLTSAPDEVFFEPAGIADTSDIILVGSIVKVKNYDLLLDIAERMPEFSFAIIGTGTEEYRLRTAAKLRCIDNIDWRGGAGSNAVRDALAAAKIFLSLSFEEGTPTAALEAMAVGTPVVITPSNDYSSLLANGEAGVALVDWDLEEIIITLRKLLDDNERRAAMSACAQRRAASERWHVKAKQVTDAMEQALSHLTQPHADPAL